MDTNALYALFAANVYSVSPAVRTDLNAAPLPGPEWSVILNRSTATGFMARAYKNATTGEVVVAYAETTSENWLDWATGNVPAAAGLPAPQVAEAAQFYLDVLQLQPNADITFTGHSLGGGRASLMA